MSAAPFYEVWDTATANLIRDFPTEFDALIWVREIVQLDGAKMIATWELARSSDGASSEPIAAGDELARRAESAVPA